MKPALVLAIVSMLIAGSGALAEEALSGRFLFRVVETSEPHRDSLSALIKGRGDLPNWVRNMVSRGGYVALASVAVDVGGTMLERFSACEPHNCSGSQVKVLFSADGKHAVMRIADKKHGEIFLGDPSEVEKAELSKADE